MFWWMPNFLGAIFQKAASAAWQREAKGRYSNFRSFFRVVIYYSISSLAGVNLVYFCTLESSQ